jgi:alanine dehydrogenase
MVRTVGLPRMHKEVSERRDFLPSFVAFLDAAGASEIVVEDGYGSGFGASEDEYRAASSRVRFGSHAEALGADVVVVLRCPDPDELRHLRPGALLVSMLHLGTRPERAELLAALGVHGLSMDGIVDDHGVRLVQNLEATAWNGVREAFRVLSWHHPNFSHPDRRPLHVTCLGAGGVAGHAVRAATRYGDHDLREELVAKNVPGVEVVVVDFDLTWHEDYMRERLGRTDLLIDATQRRDASRPVVPNRWIAELPPDAVLLDLAADPYDFEADPPRVKGIEGIPHGNLDRWVFPIEDPAWDRVDRRVDTTNRRTALSCYSWPGLEPAECMAAYGEQLEPVVGLVLATDVGAWSIDGASHLERAAARAETSRFLVRSGGAR